MTVLGAGFAMLLQVQTVKIFMEISPAGFQSLPTAVCLADLRASGQSPNVSREGSPNRNALLRKSKICGLESILTAVF